MSNVIGYARVSTREQNTAAQEAELRTAGAVRAMSAAVRGIQTGYLRYYAALLLVGLTGLGAYFLISA